MHGIIQNKTKDQIDLTHDATQQSFTKKHTVDLENVQRNKIKKERERENLQDIK
jgi:hypothetical protein